MIIVKKLCRNKKRLGKLPAVLKKKTLLFQIKTITVKCHLINVNINNGEDLYNPFWNSSVNPFLEIIFVPFIFQQSQLSSNRIDLTFFS